MTSPSPTIHRRQRSGSECIQGSARYVDYLERQIADLLVQLQAYTSPAPGATSHASKMRKLTTEARNLRAELNDWEAKFNIRVKDEVALRTAQDISLRGKLNALEDRLEAAQERCRDAEEELEEARERLREMKGLEEENRALELRVETLTMLLAEATGTSRSVSRVRTASASTGAGTPVESRRGSVEVPQEHSSPGGVSDYGISDPIEQVLALCETAPPLTPVSPLRARRMRRFPSGSSAPKTLILPSAAVGPGSPTLPTLRTFFGASVADPGSMCDSTRPNSAGSGRGGRTSGGSLFAELARAENEAVEEGEVSPTFAMVAGAVANPTPLILRAVVGMGRGVVGAPFVGARRKAMAVLTGVVGGGVNGVRGRRRVRRGVRCGCCTCGKQEQRVVGLGAEVAGVVAGGVVARKGGEDDAVENVWLWVRFVVAIVVALGVAVREGPAVVLGDGEEFDSVCEEERETAIRSLGGGRVYGVSAASLEESRAERVRREWKGMGDERLRMWERERARSGSGGGVHVGEGRRKGMEWGV